MERLPDAGSEEPSDLSRKGHLDALPRSMRGYQTVNLHLTSTFNLGSSVENTDHHRIRLRHRNQRVAQN